MKAAELRSKTDVELQLELDRLAKERFELRMTQVTSQEKRTHRPGALRRDVARVKTILSERRIAALEKAEAEAADEAKAAAAQAANAQKEE